MSYLKPEECATALATLAALVDRTHRAPDTLTEDDFRALRACADHVGREIAAHLGPKVAAQAQCEWEGLPDDKHDRGEWLDLLTYVADPF